MDYTVQPGDSWASIAQRLGNERLMQYLAEANGGVLMLRPGETVYIPDNARQIKNPVVTDEFIGAANRMAQGLGQTKFMATSGQYADWYAAGGKGKMPALTAGSQAGGGTTNLSTAPEGNLGRVSTNVPSGKTNRQARNPAWTLKNLGERGVVPTSQQVMAFQALNSLLSTRKTTQTRTAMASPWSQRQESTRSYVPINPVDLMQQSQGSTQMAQQNFLANQKTNVSAGKPSVQTGAQNRYVAKALEHQQLSNESIPVAQMIADFSPGGTQKAQYSGADAVKVFGDQETATTAFTSAGYLYDPQNDLYYKPEEETSTTPDALIGETLDWTPYYTFEYPYGQGNGASYYSSSGQTYSIVTQSLAMRMASG
jgi:hypothetical protein